MIITIGAVAVIAVNNLTGCTSRPQPEQETETSETETETVTETTAETAEQIPELTIEALESLDGVASVEDISISPDVNTGSQNITFSDQKNYVIYFEQPLDWNDPSKGTFEQRVSLTYTEVATPEVIYDFLVHGFAIRTWQYAQDFNSIRAALDMKGEEGYIDEIYYLLTGDRPAGDNPYVVNEGTVPLSYDYYPYYVQCMKELGYFRVDFSYLRNALEAEGSGAKLAVTEDMEDMLSLKLFIYPEVLETLSFDRSLHDDLVTWSKTTGSYVIVLFGGSDVWYPLRLPDVPDRENYHTFVDDLSAHGHIYARIDLYSRYDIQELIDEGLKG